MSDRPADRPVPPPAHASARKRAYTDDGTNDETMTQRRVGMQGREVIATTGSPRRTPEREEVKAQAKRRSQPHKGTLGGSNRMLSARDVAAMLAVPESTVRGRWREWGLPAYRIGKHLRWRERDVIAWIDRQNA